MRILPIHAIWLFTKNLASEEAPCLPPNFLCSVLHKRASSQAFHINFILYVFVQFADILWLFDISAEIV